MGSQGAEFDATFNQMKVKIKQFDCRPFCKSLQLSDQLKVKGNELLKLGSFVEAIELYNQVSST